MRAPRHLKRIFVDEHGGPAMEFALVAAMVMVLIPVFFDVTSIINSHMRLEAGMRAGEQFTLKYPSDSAGIRQAVISASGLPTNKLTVNNVQTCECSGLSSSCTLSCAQYQAPAHYSKITATYAYSPLYTYHGLFPDPYNITHTVSVRTQ